MNIEKRHRMTTSNHLDAEAYFTSILQEGYLQGLLTDFDIENIQLQCLNFLASKSEGYNRGESSSIRVEMAEKIMKSNLYTVGLYLKSLPDADQALKEFKTAEIAEIYYKGRELIKTKFYNAQEIYKQAQNNKLLTVNYTYNATLDDSGVGIFFKLYNPDYEAYEIPAAIDYQLCNPVADLTGVEYMQKYLGNLFLENEFCSNFSAQDIHYLLCGYDENYKDLLINIFEQVLTAALGCLLVNRDIVRLNVSQEEVQRLQDELSKEEAQSLALKIHQASGRLFEELNITNSSLRRYIESSLSKITANIFRAAKTNTLVKTLISPMNPDLKPKIKFLSPAKMDDRDYRKLIDELLICRYTSDKLALIKEKVRSFGDFEDLLFDAQLNEEEIALLFNLLENVEIGALIRRHPFKSGIQAVDLSEEEQALRGYLKNYVDSLTQERKEQIFRIADSLEED